MHLINQFHRSAIKHTTPFRTQNVYSTTIIDTNVWFERGKSEGGLSEWLIYADIHISSNKFQYHTHKHSEAKNLFVLIHQHCCSVLFGFAGFFLPFTCIIFCVSTNFFATTSIIVNIYVYILPNEPVCVYHFMRNKVQKKLIRNNQSVNIYFVTTRFIASGLLKIHISRCIGR